MHLRAIAAMVFAIVLTACASTAPVPQTAKQEWFTARAAYDGALAAASEYRRDCARKPDLLQSRCMSTVMKMRKINREALDWQELGDMAFAEGDDEFLDEATDQLENLRDRLEAEVIADMQKEGL